MEHVRAGDFDGGGRLRRTSVPTVRQVLDWPPSRVGSNLSLCEYFQTPRRHDMEPIAESDGAGEAGIQMLEGAR
jgi:hypothetical protein